MAASSGKRNVTNGLRPSVCLSRRRILNVTHQAAARDVASVHFCQSITITDKGSVFFPIFERANYCRATKIQSQSITFHCISGWPFAPTLNSLQSTVSITKRNFPSQYTTDSCSPLLLFHFLSATKALDFRRNFDIGADIMKILWQWRGGARVERWTCDQRVVGSNPTWGKSCVTTLEAKNWLPYLTLERPWNGRTDHTLSYMYLCWKINEDQSSTFWDYWSPKVQFKKKETHIFKFWSPSACQRHARWVLG